MTKISRLHVAASENDSDMYYATRFLAPDPFVFFEAEGKKVLMTSDLEYGRALEQAKVDQVVSYSEFDKQLEPAKRTMANYILAGLERFNIHTVQVPQQFSLGLAEKLKLGNLQITLAEKNFFEERLSKSAKEIEYLQQSVQAAESSMRVAIDMIASSKINAANLLEYQGQLLTSEMVKKAIAMHLLEKNYMAAHTIVAGGIQGVDPHNSGSGPLPAHQSIVLDIFPRSLDSLYWGDLSRTVCKGKASDTLKKMYRAVQDAQDMGFQLLKPGVDGKWVHEQVCGVLEKAGFPNKTINGKKEGFIHGTGHGLGLDIHESPSVSIRTSMMMEGAVVTVEPGLYFSEWGAVRLEDVAHVTQGGCVNLTTIEKKLEV
jgi:Xaa-Pro aminopeptidase